VIQRGVSRWRGFAIRLIAVTLVLVVVMLGWLNSGLAKRFFERIFFLDTVEMMAARYSLDPATVLAVIYVESSFNPRARSSKGAVGLMQIMPVTAREMGDELGYRLDEIDLEDAEINIRLGTYYLATLLRRYEELDRALQAYNGGIRIIEEAGQMDGEHPYLETRQFVENVKRWHWRFARFLAIKESLTFGGEG